MIVFGKYDHEYNNERDKNWWSVSSTILINPHLKAPFPDFLPILL